VKVFLFIIWLVSLDVFACAEVFQEIKVETRLRVEVGESKVMIKYGADIVWEKVYKSYSEMFCYIAEAKKLSGEKLVY